MGALISAPLSMASACLGSCAASCACAGCKSCVSGLSSVTRFAYMMLFTLSIFLAWVMRDYAQPLMKKIPWIAHITGEPSDEWFGKQAVYRISFGNFLFFALWSVLLVGVKYKKEARAKLHTDGWFLKLILWAAMNAFPFFLPNESMEVYSMFSRFGSGFFLVIQMTLLLDFTHAWNDSWVSKEHYGWVAGLLTMTTACYGLCIAGVVVMYEFFDPAGETCNTNVTLITITIVMFVVFSAISLLPQVEHGSLFPSAVIALYTVYLCFSALGSQPADYKCNGMGHKMDSTKLWMGMIFALASVSWSAFSAGSRSIYGENMLETATSTPLVSAPGSKSMLRRNSEDDGDEEAGSSIGEYEEVDYSYAWFHTMFALACMYTCMLLTGWGSPDVAGKDTIDVGWTSYWVKTVAQWVMGGLYMWTLLAPIILRDRDFS